MVAVLVAATAAGGAGSAGAVEYRATGTVVRVTDGDTFLGRVPSGAGGSRIRLSGVQAMERGECHAIEAERALARMLPPKSRVTVAARFKNANVPNRKGSQPRPLRLAYDSKGQDVQERLLLPGLVLPNSIRRETLNEGTYSRAAQIAAAGHRGIFDPSFCGTRYSPGAEFRLMVNWNADGNDRVNVTGKYLRLVNKGSAPVPVGGWLIRTSKHQTFTFPAGTTLAPNGGAVVVYNGSGVNSGGTFYFGRRVQITNPYASRYHIGSMYLVDPQGNFRAWSFWPCSYQCPDPLGGKVSMTVVFDPDGNENLDPNQETINITNISTETLDYGYNVVETGARVFEFPAGTMVQPGQTAVIHIGRGTPSGLDFYLGESSSILPNSSGIATLRTHEDVREACYSWGLARC